MIVRTENLTTGYKRRGEEVVLSENLNLSFRSGNMISLLGRNGGGKSTLLKTLAGSIPSLGGKIFINDEDSCALDVTKRARLISIVATGRISAWSSSAEEIVGYGRSPYTGYWGRLSQKDMEIVNRAIELAGVSHLRNKNINALSDGEYQKVMIAKALAQDTPLILLDEPSAFLDFPSKVELMQLLRNLALGQDKIIVQSTHDINIALSLSSHILMLDKEIGCDFGTPSELAQNGKLESYFDNPGIILDRKNVEFRLH